MLLLAPYLGNLLEKPAQHPRLVGKVEMEVVGILRGVPLVVFFDAADEHQKPSNLRELVVEKLYVVRGLPVPLHVSSRRDAPCIRPLCARAVVRCRQRARRG